MNPDPQPLSHWERGESRSLALTRIFDLRGVTFRHPVRSIEREFAVIHAPDWVNVVALTSDHRLVMVNQFRYGTNAFSWEVPGGMIDAGEDPVVAGLRELQEETGYAGGTARLLGSIHPNPAILNNRCHLVLVEGVTLTTAVHLDPDEEIEVAVVPVDEVLAWAHSGKITHALVLNALLLFAPRWAEIKAGKAGR